MRHRLGNEDGHNAAARNWGRFALMLIPAALGLGAVLWIAAAFGWIDLARMRRIDRRTMESVGMSAPPIAPVVIVNHDAECLKIESSFMRGKKVVFYVKNTCQHTLTMPNYSYRVMAHDGTVIESGRWAFGGDRSLIAGERREQRTSLDTDDRIVRVELYALD